MISHLALRGEPWVAGGKLALRHQSIKLSPNYPSPNR